jgi:UDP-N-acetylglucosamine acyltransferase
MPKIHPMSVIDPKAQLADDVEVGPFCVIGPDVTLEAGSKLLSHVVVTGITQIGKHNIFHPHCVVGDHPQDKKYAGAPTRLVIGDNNQIREGVTIHTGTEKGGGVTRVGSNNLLMVNAHIGHDAQFGDNNIISNNVMIAGHVVCGNNAVLSGGVGVHHFATIGDLCYIGGNARITRDVPPFCRVDHTNEVRDFNIVGLQRAGFTPGDIQEVEHAWRKIFRRGKGESMAAAMSHFHLDNGINPHVKHLIEFLKRRDAGRDGRYLESLRK